MLAFLLQSSALERDAYRAYQARDWAAAARLYESFHASSSGTASSYDNLGVAWINLGEWSKAEQALLKAVELDPRHRWAYNHLGFAYREQSRHEDAVRMFRRQIEISPKDPYAYRNLAAVLAFLGRLEEADRAARDHEGFTYERGAVYIDMACSLNARNRPDQARKYLDQAEAAGADRALLAQESAHYFLTVRDFRRAEEQYLKLAEYRPYDSPAALRLGMLYFDTGNLEKATAALARVLSVDDAGQVAVRVSATATRTMSLAALEAKPDRGRSLLGDLPLDLGRAARLARLERHRRAEDVEPFLAACRDLLRDALPPAAEAAVREALGWRLLGAGRIAAAKAELERAYSLAPLRRLTAYRLAVALEKSGELEQALALYARSLAPLAETAIDCGCEQPDVAAREKIARALHGRLYGDRGSFDEYRRRLR
jgi:tetratricopeptide (TPR) repeat protein